MAWRSASISHGATDSGSRRSKASDSISSSPIRRTSPPATRISLICASSRRLHSYRARMAWTRLARSSPRRPRISCLAGGYSLSMGSARTPPCANYLGAQGLKMRVPGPIWPVSLVSRGRNGRMEPMDIKQRIKEQVTGSPVVLYMKGTPQAPQCGFSALAVQVLTACGVSEFQSFNVLADAEIRQGIKEFANWPTVPQLYVNGEFVGGSDIMREMYQSGELQKLLEGTRQKA